MKSSIPYVSYSNSNYTELIEDIIFKYALSMFQEGLPELQDLWNDTPEDKKQFFNNISELVKLKASEKHAYEKQMDFHNTTQFEFIRDTQFFNQGEIITLTKDDTVTHTSIKRYLPGLDITDNYTIALDLKPVYSTKE